MQAFTAVFLENPLSGVKHLPFRKNTGSHRKPSFRAGLLCASPPACQEAHPGSDATSLLTITSLRTEQEPRAGLHHEAASQRVAHSSTHQLSNLGKFLNTFVFYFIYKTDRGDTGQHEHTGCRCGSLCGRISVLRCVPPSHPLPSPEVLNPPESRATTGVR